VCLLIRSLAEIELPRLAIVVGEALGTNTAFLASFSYCGAMKALGGRLRGEVSDKLGVGLAYATRPTRLRHLHVSVTLMICKRALGRVDREAQWKLGERGAKARVEIGE
jgi:hypothetical protein